MIDVEIYYSNGASNEMFTRSDWYKTTNALSYEDEAARFIFDFMRQETDNFILSHRFEIVVNCVNDFNDRRHAHLFASKLYWLLEEHCPTYDPDNLVIRFEV